MRHKKRDCLCEAHSALFVRLFSLGCESSHSRGHDNELVHPLELKLRWKKKLARRRFNFVCALNFMRFTGLLDRTHIWAKGHVAGPTNGPSRASEQSSSRANRKFKSGRPRSKCPKAPEKNLKKNKVIAPEKLVLISLGGGGFCKFNPGRPSLKFGFGCRGLL